MSYNVSLPWASSTGTMSQRQIFKLSEIRPSAPRATFWNGALELWDCGPFYILLAREITTSPTSFSNGTTIGTLPTCNSDSYNNWGTGFCSTGGIAYKSGGVTPCPFYIVKDLSGVLKIYGNDLVNKGYTTQYWMINPMVIPKDAQSVSPNGPNYVFEFATTLSNGRYGPPLRKYLLGDLPSIGSAFNYSKSGWAENGTTTWRLTNTTGTLPRTSVNGTYYIWSWGNWHLINFIEHPLTTTSENPAILDAGTITGLTGITESSSFGFYKDIRSLPSVTGGYGGNVPIKLLSNGRIIVDIGLNTNTGFSQRRFWGQIFFKTGSGTEANHTDMTLKTSSSATTMTTDTVLTTGYYKPFVIGTWRGNFATTLCSHGKRDFTDGFEWWRTEGDNTITNLGYFPSASSYTEPSRVGQGLSTLSTANSPLQSFLGNNLKIPIIICVRDPTPATYLQGMMYPTSNYYAALDRNKTGNQGIFYFTNSIADSNLITSSGKYRICCGYVLPNRRDALETT